MNSRVLSRATATLTLAFACILTLGCSSGPSSFQRSPAGWKAISVRPQLENDYSRAWQITVDSIARNWDIEILDKDSGYLRTSWIYGIKGVSRKDAEHYKARIIIKFPRVTPPLSSVDVKTEAEWFEKIMFSEERQWVEGFDIRFNRDIYDVLSGRLGRTSQ